MKKEIIVRCVFSPAGKTLPELMKESFRVYLYRILAERAEDAIELSR